MGDACCAHRVLEERCANEVGSHTGKKERTTRHERLYHLQWPRFGSEEGFHLLNSLVTQELSCFARRTAYWALQRPETARVASNQQDIADIVDA